MRVTSAVSAAGWRLVILGLAVAWSLVPVVWAQGQAEAEPPDPFMFTSDAAIIMYTVKPDAVMDFEIVWRAIQQRTASTTNAEVREVVDSMKMYEPETPSAAAVTYVVYIDPVAQESSYSPTFILYESGLFERAEADELFQKLTGALVPQNPISTMPINSMR
jgi:hypothetical protein